MKKLIVLFNTLLKKQKKLETWQRIVTVLAAVITFATTYSLILPAITVEKNRTEDVAGMYLEAADDPSADQADTQDAIDPQIIAEGAPEEYAPVPLTASGDDYTVNLTYDETSGIPEGATLDVSEIAQDSEEYAAYLNDAKIAMGLSDEDMLPEYAARFFDIKIMVDGQEFTPESGVTVEVTYAEP